MEKQASGENGIVHGGHRPARAGGAVLIVGLLLMWSSPCAAYSVLSHEAVIDAAWDTDLKPLLLKRFPEATPDELRKAHGYAYGGAIIQDLGYYPHGSIFFSDLTHYVRSGDFILMLLRDSRNLDEYAFALGAMAHYAADNDGHPLATNRSVPLLYPKTRRKFGDYVTYEQDPLAHVKTEFGFDVLEVARGRYAPDSYHDFIGFEVAEELLERAFRETYGVDLKVVLPNEQQVMNSYRRDVSKLIPKATRIAWTLKKAEIQKDQPGVTKKKFLYNLSRASYEKEWGKNYLTPSPAERFLAFLYKLIPKFGPLKVLQLRTPTPATERMFEASFNSTMDRYRSALGQQAAGDLALANVNFDVGSVTPPGQYRRNDDVHAKLLGRLAQQGFAGLPAEVRAELLTFYAAPDVPIATKHNAKAWSKVQAELRQLQVAAPAAPDISQVGPTAWPCRPRQFALACASDPASKLIRAPSVGFTKRSKSTETAETQPAWLP